jgi:hypothetical protein
VKTDLRRAVKECVEAMADEARATQPKRDALLELLAPAQRKPVVLALVRNPDADDVIAMVELLTGRKATPRQRRNVEKILATRRRGPYVGSRGPGQP